LSFSCLRAAVDRADPSSPIRVDSLPEKTHAILEEQTRAENEFRPNQTAILGNQATMVKNQKTILASQGGFKKNQSALTKS
jgi:hypothetical protein